MKFICINTAGPRVEAALYNDKKITYKSDAFKKASETLFVFVEELLSAENLTPQDLDFLAVVTGPGSFTGIRIGLTMVKTFAQFCKKRVVGVTYHTLLAYNNPKCQKTVVLSDAANGLIYASVFGADKACISPIEVRPTQEISAYADAVKPPYMLVADDTVAKLAAISEKKHIISADNKDALIAATLANFEKYGAIDYEKIKPLYVRVAQAEANLS